MFLLGFYLVILLWKNNTFWVERVLFFEEKNVEGSNYLLQLNFKHTIIYVICNNF